MENPHNLSAYLIIEISLVLCSAYVVSTDQDKFVFYINKYINWNQFNQLYDSDEMEKSISNANAIVRKLQPALIRVTNNRLEAVEEKRRKKEEIMEKQKAKAMAAKRRRTRRKISSSNKREDESDTGNDTDPDQANDKYLLQL